MLVRTEPVHVTQPNLTLTQTPARRNFKVNAGQNNHFLITVLVGLDSVKRGSAELSPEFSTSWSPKDLASSAARSREYALKTSLAWITDVVDDYRRSLLSTPGLFDEEAVSRMSKQDGRAERLAALAKALDLRDVEDLDLVRLGIHWRNRMVHASATSTLNNQVAARLRSAAIEIHERHRGLDIEASVARSDKALAPRMKEVASIIHAAQRLVQSLDQQALGRQSLTAYADSLLSQYLEQGLAAGQTNLGPKLWPGNPEKTVERLRQLLVQGGFSPTDAIEHTLPDEYLRDISVLTVRQGISRFRTRDKSS